MERTAIIGFLIGVTNALGDYRCPTGISSGTVFSASCYEFISEEMTWKSARANCHARGGRLATIANEKAQSWLAARADHVFPNRQGVWLGLHDRTHEGTFVWDNYRSLAAMSGTYFYWNSGEPNDHSMLGDQDCVYMRRNYQWRWVDVECDSWLRKYSSVCEYEAIGLRWSSHVPFTVLSTLPAETRQVSTMKFSTDGAEDNMRSLTPQGYVSDTLTAEMMHVSTDKYATGGATDNERSLTTQIYITVPAELLLDMKTERLVTPWPDTVQLKLLTAIGVIVLILITGVVVIAVCTHHHRTKINATARLTLSTSAQIATAAQPKGLCCPPEWRSPIKAETIALFDSSPEQKQVNAPSASCRSSSGNIYVDIDAFFAREQSAVSSEILRSADPEQTMLSYIGTDLEVPALPPPPPPPLALPNSIRVTEAVFTPKKDLLVAAADIGLEMPDVVGAMVGALSLQKPNELAIVSGGCTDRAAEGYLEFVSRGTQSETLPTPIV